VHLNCMAQWLADAAHPACISCRESLPRPPPRPPPPAAAAAPQRADEGSTSTTTSDIDETTSDAAAEEVDETTSDADADADETTTTDGAGAEDESTTDETTSSGDGSTVADARQGAAPPQQAAHGQLRRPRCEFCSNLAASECENRLCGSCCLQFGGRFCVRHSC